MYQRPENLRFRVGVASGHLVMDVGFAIDQRHLYCVKVHESVERSWCNVRIDSFDLSHTPYFGKGVSLFP
jgi:hypothetical protein